MMINPYFPRRSYRNDRNRGTGSRTCADAESRRDERRLPALRKFQRKWKPLFMTQSVKPSGRSVFWTSNVSSSHLRLLFHFSCTMLPVKAVREAVITTLIEWHDKFVSIIYVNEESPVSTFHITPSYIPSGFSQIESSGESTGHYYGQFQNSAGDWFSLRVFPVENTQTISWDNEFSSYYSISLIAIKPSGVSWTMVPILCCGRAIS